MWKAGGIVAAIALVLVLLASAGLSPLCGIVCLAPLAGLAAGYLAGVFDKPGTGEAGAKCGAVAGALAGVGAFVGQLGAGLINFAFADTTTELAQSPGVTVEADAVRAGTLIWGLCGGMFDIALAVGLGALAGYVWFKMSGPKTGPASIQSM